MVEGEKHLFENWAGEMPLELADSTTFGKRRGLAHVPEGGGVAPAGR